jgi:Phage P22-like portal protein
MTDDKDKLAKSEKDIWEEARDRLKLCQDAESDNRKLAKADLVFREGEQWDKKPMTSASLETIELTINLTDPLVRRVVNNMKQQRPRGKCHPVGDNADVETAQVINGICRHIEYRSNASVAYDTGGEMAVTMGWGYWRLIIEYASPDSFDQEIKILPIRNPFTVYLDPGSIMPDGSDATWGIISIKEKLTEYRRKYGDIPKVAWTSGEDDLKLDWESEQEIRLAEYFRIVEKTDILFELSDPSGRKFVKWKDEMPNPQSMQQAGLVVTSQRKSSRKTVELYKLNGLKVIGKQIIPGTFIPIIRCEGNAVDIDGKVYRRGMVRAMQDPQRMVNFGEVAKIKRLGLTPQAPWVAAEGQLVGHPEWEATNRAAHPVLTYKPVTVQTAQGEMVLPPPQRQAPAGIEQGFSEFVGNMRANLNAVAGSPNEPGQDMQGEVISGKAINARQGLSDQSHFQYYDNQTMAIDHTWTVMLEWIPHVYSTDKMQRIIGEDGLPQMVQINQAQNGDGVSKVKNDLTVGRYDVVMDTGPGYMTKRQEGLAQIMQLMGTPLGEEAAKVGSDLIFRLFDDPYMQQLADRMAAMTPQGLEKAMEGMPDNAKAIIQSLSKQLQQAQQQLQAAQAGITKAHIDATVKAHGIEEKTKTEKEWMETELKKEHMKGTVQLHTEEVKAGASLIDSRGVQAHEKVMEGLKQLNSGENNG